jgi:homogentisate 1,2-dioxygenase
MQPARAAPLRFARSTPATAAPQMPYFMQAGHVPRKRFSQHPGSDGRLLSAEVIGSDGFSSDMCLLYHRHAPAAVTAVAPFESQPAGFAANEPLLPRLFDTSRITSRGDTIGARVPIVGNSDVALSFVQADTPSPLYRNASGDELFFVHDGEARLETVLGVIDVVAGDYVIVPRSITHRWVPSEGSRMRALVFEMSGHVRPPKRYLSPAGQYLQEAPYFELDLKRPAGPLLAEGEGVDVLVRTRGGYTRYTYRHHPFDVVGWFGCNYPYAFNIADFSPITGSFHRPPPVHQVFEAPGCVVCNFVPRLLDYDPRAMPIPSFHSNVDSDEIIFYAEGNFMSRKGSGIGRGSISLHPAGHIHGPHPGAWEAGPTRIGQRTEEVAVMLDTFRPLGIAATGAALEQPGYIHSWTAG